MNPVPGKVVARFGEKRTVSGKTDRWQGTVFSVTRDEGVHAVRDGKEAVEKVTTSLEHSSQVNASVTQMMDGVVDAVESQTTAIVQVTEGIDQISAVVQITSAATEKSAATAQELSDQSRLMNELARRFRLD